MDVGCDGCSERVVNECGDALAVNDCLVYSFRSMSFLYLDLVNFVLSLKPGIESF